MKDPPYTRTQQELVVVLRRMAAESKIDLDLPNIHLKN